MPRCKLAKFFFLSSLPRWHYSPMRPFVSFMDYSQSALVFDLSFQFVILPLLITVCAQFHIPILISHLTSFSTVRPIPLSLTFPRPQFRSSNSQLFYCDKLSTCRPTPNLEDQSTVFITPGQGGSTMPLGTRYPFWSPITTCMGCSGAILFPVTIGVKLGN